MALYLLLYEQLESFRLFWRKCFHFKWLPFKTECVQQCGDIHESRYETSIDFHETKEQAKHRLSTGFISHYQEIRLSLYNL